MYADNDWYGHKKILARYCGLNRPRPIFGSVRHGWGLHLTPSMGQRRLTKAPMYYWSRRHLNEAIGHGVPNAKAIGAPFVYLVRQLWPNGRPPHGQGTILFPSHAHEGTTYTIGEAALAENVMNSCPAPYTVSVFYQEADAPWIRHFRRLGWRVVSFGSRGDPLFLYRQAAQLAAHSHIVGNVVQTALLYGSLLGRHVRVIGPSPALSAVGGLHGSEHLEYLRQHVEGGPLMFPELHREGLSGDSAISLGWNELGADVLLTPDELRAELGWSSLPRSAAAGIGSYLVDRRLGPGARQGTPGRGRRS